MCFLELIVRKTSPLELNMLLEIDNIKMYISSYDGFSILQYKKGTYNSFFDVLLYKSFSMIVETAKKEVGVSTT